MSKAPTILVVDDQPVNVKILQRKLEKEGMIVVTAGSGVEALEKIAIQKPSLVLLDVVMPEMDGMEATRRIREIERINGGHVPIVALTAHALKGDDTRCLDAGMDAFMSKPVKAGDFRQIIAQLFPAAPRA